MKQAKWEKELETIIMRIMYEGYDMGKKQRKTPYKYTLDTDKGEKYWYECKSIISRLLASQRKEIREKVEGMKRLKQMWGTDSPSWERLEADRVMYNQALNDILALLKK